MLFRIRYWITAGLILCGAAFAWFGALRPMNVIIDGVPFLVKTRAFTSRQVLTQLGLQPENGDRLNPAGNHILGWDGTIRFDRAVPVVVGIAATPYTHISITPERIPANLLFQAGVALFPGDSILWNGQTVDFAETLPPADSHTLYVARGIPLSVISSTDQQRWYSSATTPLAAMWEAGYRLQQSDWLSSETGKELVAETSIHIAEGRAVTIRDGTREWSSRTSASTVGEALAHMNVVLNALDYTKPAEDAPIPTDGHIQVVRVTEEVVLQQESIPFEKEFVEDPETELDQTSIVSPGAYGLQVTRIRVRFEDGVETERTTEDEWMAAEPQTQKVGYGTKIVIRTLQTSAGTIEYWRAVPVYATSYSPCNIGIEGQCGSSTAMGTPVQQGVIGVIRSWYNQMAGQQVFVPGYGAAIIADIGGGVPGKNWIDLAFTDENYVPWHQDVILYFLTPVPAAIPWILP